MTESLFLAKQSALANEKKKLDEAPMLYTCGLCNKEYRSSKAHAQHLTSKSHLLRASQGVDKQEGESTIIRPLPKRVANKPSLDKEPETEETEESEWEEVDPEEDLVDEATDSLTQLNFNEHTPLEEDVDEDDNDEDDVVDPSCCFMCDQRHKTIESCIVHLHKKHSFFIPDIEYLKDPEGFLTYLGVKVVLRLLCFSGLRIVSSLSWLSCWIPLFRSKGIFCVSTATKDAILSPAWRESGSIWMQKAIAKCAMVMVLMTRKENLRTSMITAAGLWFLWLLCCFLSCLSYLLINFVSSKALGFNLASLCFMSLFSLRFFHLFPSYVDAQGNQLVVADDVANIVEVTNGGELVTSRREENKVFTKILGSREFLRYYRQKPRPTPPNMALTASLAARFEYITSIPSL